MIVHFYKCFGCDKEHSTGAAAIVCCAVVREVWKCSRCKVEFAAAAAADRHFKACTANGYCISTEPTDAPPAGANIHRGDLGGVSQSFSAGFGNFSTP